MTRASQRKMTVLSCWGPGATLPSCRFRGGRKHAAPETCSACARTGSPSTDTSTTTRWAKAPPRDHGVPAADVPAGVEGLVHPVQFWCGPLWGVQSHDEVIIQALQNTKCVCVCVCWLLADSSWKDFLTPSLSKHSKCSRNDENKLQVSACSSTLCPLSCRCVHACFSPPDLRVYSSVRLSH